MTYCPTHPLHSSSYVKLLLFVIPVCLAHAPLVRGDITAHIPAQQRVGALDVMWTRCGGAQAGDPVERRLKTPPEDPFQVALILDVDGTLYGWSSGVEQQIVEAIYGFFARELGMSAAECDAVYRRFGSTVEGLRQEGKLNQEQLERYYQEVFESVSLSGLSSSAGTSSGDDTGYQLRASVAVMLRAHEGPVFVASNSSLRHVEKVLAALGLADIPFAGVLTPDTREWLTKSSPEFYEPILGHDAVRGRALWLLDDNRVNLEVASRLGMRTMLVGDGGGASGGADDEALPLDQALACAVGAIPHPRDWKFSEVDYLRSKNVVDGLSRSQDVWKILAMEVSATVLERGTFRVADLGCGLLPLLEEFVELGRACGVLRLEYCGLEKEAGVFEEACKGLLKKGFVLSRGIDDAVPGNASSGSSGNGPGGKGADSRTFTRCGEGQNSSPEICVRVINQDFTTIDPEALFPSAPLGRGDEGAPLSAEAMKARGSGESLPRKGTAGGEQAAEGLDEQGVDPGTSYPVFDEEGGGDRRPHLIVGCCMADLLSPSRLMRTLLRLSAGETLNERRVAQATGSGYSGEQKGGSDHSSGERGPLVYLPITFIGRTEMHPAAAQEGSIPSDDSVLSAYDTCLREEQGHHTAVEELCESIHAHGGELLALAPSHWRISREAQPYVWDCLMYFVGLGLAPHPPLLAPDVSAEKLETPGGCSGSGVGSGKKGDLAGWVRRARRRKPVLEAHNVDLLFRLGTALRPDPDSNPETKASAGVHTRGGYTEGRLRRIKDVLLASLPMRSVHRENGGRRKQADGDPASTGTACGALNAIRTPREGSGTVNAARGGGGTASANGAEVGIDGVIGDRDRRRACDLSSLFAPGSDISNLRAGDQGALETPLDVARLHRGGGTRGRDGTTSSHSPPRAAFLEFVAAGKVEVRYEEAPEDAEVGEGQVVVEAICSSISSGTELKVFRGDFDSDSELDTTIKGMAGESMSYPLRYGYSLVGRVTRCGKGVDSEKFLGKLVFSFSPHSSRVQTDAESLIIVPEGIEAHDAVYLPAVETALSLVHDVHPRVGERVAIFGQGMIGLLAIAILAKTHGTLGDGMVVAVDLLADRLEVAQRLGASAAVTPADAAELAPFDVSLEVTGNPRGLQSALDLTGYGGRVILGSWYGGGAAQLNLGLAFHRSHLTIQASQVSRLSAELTDRWDKDRRFATAWSLLRELKPSSFLTTRTTGLEGAQEAFESLGAGRELGVVFRYHSF